MSIPGRRGRPEGYIAFKLFLLHKNREGDVPEVACHVSGTDLLLPSIDKVMTGSAGALSRDSLQSFHDPSACVGRVNNCVDCQVGSYSDSFSSLVQQARKFLVQRLAFLRAFQSCNSPLKPVSTAPSNRLPPNSPVGQRTAKKGSGKAPFAIGCAPSLCPLCRKTVKNCTDKCELTTNIRQM